MSTATLRRPLSLQYAVSDGLHRVGPGRSGGRDRAAWRCGGWSPTGADRGAAAELKRRCTAPSWRRGRTRASYRRFVGSHVLSAGSL